MILAGSFQSPWNFLGDRYMTRYMTAILLTLVGSLDSFRMVAGLQKDSHLVRGLGL